jgi:NTE family protein
MNVQIQEAVTTAERRLPFEHIALVLQGGGALGAYQAGVCEALAEAGINPDWIAGVSIGAINGAIIAGNPPNSRIDRLREFWTQVTAGGLWRNLGDLTLDVARGDIARNIFNQMSAGFALASGAAGFFTARPMAPWLQPAGTIEATSFYDTRTLRRTLERLVDFDRLNAGVARFSVGAVNVRTGNFVYFDTTTHTIRAEHVMASGALPPSLPAIEIEGEHCITGTEVSSPTRRCSGWSKVSRAATRSPSRSTSGAHAENFHATCSKS